MAIPAKNAWIELEGEDVTDMVSGTIPPRLSAPPPAMAAVYEAACRPITEYEQALAAATRCLDRPAATVAEIFAATGWSGEYFRDACAAGWTPERGWPKRGSARDMAETARALGDMRRAIDILNSSEERNS